MSKLSSAPTFSDFLRSPKDVLAALERDGEVVLRRRGEPSLRLTEDSTSRAELRTLTLVGQLFAASLDEVAMSRVATRLGVALPWVSLLPKSLHAEFIAEFQDTARGCIAVGRFDRLEILLEAWNATAEAYADPRLTADGADLDFLDAPEVVRMPSLSE